MMPIMGDDRDAVNIIDVVSTMMGSNGIETNKDYDLMAKESVNDNGSLNKRINEINEIPEKTITLDELILDLANSGNVKYTKLASDLMDLNLKQGQAYDKLGSDCFEKITVSAKENQNTEQRLDNNDETNMEWQTVKPKGKRTRSNSNDSEKISVESVSPNKKQKSTDNKTKLATGNDNSRNRKQLNKDSVLIVITEIPENTYFNSIKMENMILNAFPRLKENGMWTKYRINKRHQFKCYITLPWITLGKMYLKLLNPK